MLAQGRSADRDRVERREDNRAPERSRVERKEPSKSSRVERKEPSKSSRDEPKKSDASAKRAEQAKRAAPAKRDEPAKREAAKKRAESSRSEASSSSRKRPRENASSERDRTRDASSSSRDRSRQATPSSRDRSRQVSTPTRDQGSKASSSSRNREASRSRITPRKSEPPRANPSKRDARVGGKWYSSQPPAAWRWQNRPRIRVDIHWPWVHRHARKWSPRYRYRQVVHVDAGWHRGHRSSRLDVRTYYRHRVRKASGSRAELDITIDRIEIFENGHFLGAVDRIPSDLARLRATIHRNGRATFDRDLFVIGDPHLGFELISTRYYDGFVLSKYNRSHGYRAGVLDFRRERVKKVRRSRFFDPFDFAGFVPIRLLPGDESWFGDYGNSAPSRHWYGDDDLYYYGFEDLDDYARLGGDRTEYRLVTPGSHDDVRVSRSAIEPLRREDNQTFRIEAGAEIRIRREATLERIE